ncbi:Lrp/AsnC family transcriptional regulator [Nocardiopsis trehalosi]|uniref:Lrp/AsnC family transcriptional regulator n=1 Tax=Nocardiopsis trehalosi TaxID=109329 RepID=UPI0008352CDF|nr:Lrp/AsnC family transcriptional regulator [Nocardiopsis trehalosi]
MQVSTDVNETDLELINALQLAPRASWAELAQVLDVDATTLARRWRRLEDAGLVRITAFPRQETLSRMNMAYLELTCRNGRVIEVATALAEDPGTLSIQFTAGTYHLLLTVIAPQGLSDYLLTWIGGFADIVGYRAHVVTGVLFEAHRWQVRALSPDQRRRLTALNAADRGGPPAEGRVTELDQRLLTHLCGSGRAGYHELAELAGVSATTAARRLNRLLRGGIIGLRCDIARADLGWPVAAVLWGSVDPRVLDRARTDLGERVPELRLCSTIAGPENTHFIVWLRAAPDLQRVEQRLVEELPGLHIADRRVVLRTVKFMGNVMGPDERYVRTVPLRLLPPAPAA